MRKYEEAEKMKKAARNKEKEMSACGRRLNDEEVMKKILCESKRHNKRSCGAICASKKAPRLYMKAYARRSGGEI